MAKNTQTLNMTQKYALAQPDSCFCLGKCQCGERGVVRGAISGGSCLPLKSKSKRQRSRSFVKTLNILALKLIKKFFTEPCEIFDHNNVLPNNSEIKLFKSFGIKSVEMTHTMLNLWIIVDGIHECVNDEATCENCVKELDEHWKCCSNCPNAICKECDKCKECDGYYSEFDYESGDDSARDDYLFGWD